MSAAVVSFLNQKGGVGKTSTTYHLGGTIAREGHRALRKGNRVLLIDADPQASLTQGFFGPDAMRSLPSHATVAALFGDGLLPGLAELARDTRIPGLAIVPGSGHLTRHNVPEPWKAAPDQQRALCDLTAEARDAFDLVLIDCPPNLHLCSWAALAASDHLVVPLQAEDFGSQGVAAILDCVGAVQAGPNPRLRLAGYLLTMFNPRLGIHKAYETMLRQLYGEAVFSATVPLATDFKEAIARRTPIAQYKPKGASAKAIAALADELMTRVAYTVQRDDQDPARRVA
jgi:chromosome partitioning protein